MIENSSVAGIICEYNPFHNGHLYQIKKVKESGCDFVVCIMSGSVVQRGDFAIYDKWFRAKTAVENGADLVLELPAYYVLQSAEKFALGGIKILDSLGVVDRLSFGSESDNLERLEKIADVLASEPAEYKEALSVCLDSGLGYPRACEKALAQVMGDKDLTLLPNDILGANYIAQIKKIGSSITPLPLKREGDYHSTDLNSGNFPSATAIRQLISEEKDISDLVPAYDANIYSIKQIESFVLGTLRTKKPCDIKNVPGMETGLENRLISCAKSSSNLDEFFSQCVTKRYTAHRIGRVVMSTLLGIDNDSTLDYIRVLALGPDGGKLISHIKKTCPLSIVTKTADFVPENKSMFKYDILATDLAALCCSDVSQRKSGRDYTTSPVVVR